MFEPTCEFPVKTGAAFLSKNLSVYNHKAKALTFAAYLGKDAVIQEGGGATWVGRTRTRRGQVQLVSWNDKLEQCSCELVGQEEITKNAGPSGEKPVSLMQVYGKGGGPAERGGYCNNPFVGFSVSADMPQQPSGGTAGDHLRVGESMDTHQQCPFLTLHLLLSPYPLHSSYG